MPPDLLPDAVLAAHFDAVEAAARERELVREGLLDDPRQRPTILPYLLLVFFPDRLADHPPGLVFWTRFYWCHRMRRTHERLEHDGESCPADEGMDPFEDGVELDVDWDRMDPLEARAKADADAALGPGPFERPAFACGDIRPLEPGE